MGAKFIPVYQPDLSGNEGKYVSECVRSTWISSNGRFIADFEKGFAKFCGIKYTAAVCNGTVALHAALVALGVGHGDEVIVPTLTYISSVNAITYTGAKPVFADSLADTWQVDPKEIKKKITPKTKVIMAVHLYGHPCDMGKICAIAKTHGLKIVEDCAEAIGTYYKGKHVGNFGDIATFSFYGNKTITSGEGGMVASNDKALIDKVIRVKGQGLAEGRQYWHDIIGYNYRMTNLCAAIGLAQLERIQKFLHRKKEIAIRYEQLLQKSPTFFHSQIGEVEHSYWMCSILLKSEGLRDKLRDYLQVHGIETRPLFWPVHLMPMYQTAETFPVAEDIGPRGMNLPSWPGLSNDQVDFIAGHVNDFLKVKT